MPKLLDPVDYGVRERFIQELLDAREGRLTLTGIYERVREKFGPGLSYVRVRRIVQRWGRARVREEMEAARQPVPAEKDPLEPSFEQQQAEALPPTPQVEAIPSNGGKEVEEVRLPDLPIWAQQRLRQVCDELRRHHYHRVTFDLTQQDRTKVRYERTLTTEGEAEV